jgi:hypothetical protein
MVHTCQLNTWSTLMSAQHMVHTYVSSTHGPHLCQLNIWSTPMLPWPTVLLHLNQWILIIALSKRLYSQIALFSPISVFYFESYVFPLQSDTELIYSHIGQLMSITVYSSLGDWLFAHVFMFIQYLFRTKPICGIFFFLHNSSLT